MTILVFKSLPPLTYLERSVLNFSNKAKLNYIQMEMKEESKDTFCIIILLFFSSDEQYMVIAGIL